MCRVFICVRSMSILCETHRPELSSVFVTPKYDPNAVEVKAKVSQYYLMLVKISVPISTNRILYL